MPKLFKIGTLTIALFLGIVAHAQITGQAPVQFTVSPQTPGPGEQTTIQVEGIGDFIGDATITWQQNGSTALSGVGERVFTFTNGALGSRTNIHVTINSKTEGTITRDFTFAPSNINLIWEANTSVPPLYRGKALYSAGSGIKVVAFPTVVSGGKTISTNNLSFQWSHNGDPVPSDSGIGRSTFTFSGDQLQSSESVSVSVMYGGTKVGEGSVTIPARTPEVFLYAFDPLRGTLFENALPTAISLGSKEITIQAVPYFFDNQSIENGSVVYAWTLNGNDATGPDTAKGKLTLRQTSSGAGAAVLGVAVQNSDSNTFTQSAEAAMQIQFGQSSSNSTLFGL